MVSVFKRKDNMLKEEHHHEKALFGAATIDGITKVFAFYHKKKNIFKSHWRTTTKSLKGKVIGLLSTNT